jgi:NAD(P)H-dependent FMN reductase
METVATDNIQPDSGSPLNIIAICGSLNARSTTKMALSLALKGAEEYEAETRMISLRDYKLVFYGEVDEEDYPPDVFRLRKEIKEADGIIFGTPEYHGSVSGILKNMLDLMGQEQLEGKIVGLVGVAGGHTGAINSLNTMRTIGRNMHVWVLPQDVSVADSSKTFNDDGTVNDPVIKNRLLTLGQQVVKFASLQRSVRQTDFMKMWEGLPTW